ncbi:MULTISPECIES: hypothetical protein [Nonomuraea]|uniref:ATP-binding protein n=1 Tax=Nonomuraea mangrovi TaxID=2316207 RepID=A0ABW4SXE8_9ACTN
MELLVGELVANSLQHTQEMIRLTLFFEDGLLRCEVEDPSAVWCRPGHATANDARP